MCPLGEQASTAQARQTWLGAAACALERASAPAGAEAEEAEGAAAESDEADEAAGATTASGDIVGAGSGSEHGRGSAPVRHGDRGDRGDRGDTP